MAAALSNLAHRQTILLERELKRREATAPGETKPGPAAAAEAEVASLHVDADCAAPAPVIELGAAVAQDPESDAAQNEPPPRRSQQVEAPASEPRQEEELSPALKPEAAADETRTSCRIIPGPWYHAVLVSTSVPASDATCAPKTHLGPSSPPIARRAAEERKERKIAALVREQRFTVKPDRGHSNNFREYCDHYLDKGLNETVLAMLGDLHR